MKKVIDKLMGQMGYVIIKKAKRAEYGDWDDPNRSHMISIEHQLALHTELAGIIHNYTTGNFPNYNLKLEEVIKIVESFFKVYSSREFINNSGGSGFHNSLWLYFYIRAFQPKLIVESGVWKGLGSYIMEQANPAAQIHCFDLTFRHLTYKSDKIGYHEIDWSQYDLGNIDPEKSVVFFDCHINHAKRIIESAKKGFKHLIFDDNPPIHKLYAFGLPGLPSVDMILNTDLKDGEKIKWKWNNKDKEFIVNRAEIDEAKSLIKKAHTFPDLSSPTRYSSKLGGQAFLTYVQL